MDKSKYERKLSDKRSIFEPFGVINDYGNIGQVVFRECEQREIIVAIELRIMGVSIFAYGATTYTLPSKIQSFNDIIVSTLKFYVYNGTSFGLAKRLTQNGNLQAIFHFKTHSMCLLLQSFPQQIHPNSSFELSSTGCRSNIEGRKGKTWKTHLSHFKTKQYLFQFVK